MTAPRAANLPVGSIVAQRQRVYLKCGTDEPSLPWTHMEGTSMYVNYASDEDVQDRLDAGAQVLRVGDGSCRADI